MKRPILRKLNMCIWIQREVLENFPSHINQSPLFLRPDVVDTAYLTPVENDMLLYQNFVSIN